MAAGDVLCVWFLAGSRAGAEETLTLVLLFFLFFTLAVELSAGFKMDFLCFNDLDFLVTGAVEGSAVHVEALEPLLQLSGCWTP